MVSGDKRIYNYHNTHEDLMYVNVVIRTIYLNPSLNESV